MFIKGNQVLTPLLLLHSLELFLQLACRRIAIPTLKDPANLSAPHLPHPYFLKNSVIVSSKNQVLATYSSLFRRKSLEICSGLQNV